MASLFLITLFWKPCPSKISVVCLVHLQLIISSSGLCLFEQTTCMLGPFMSNQ